MDAATRTRPTRSVDPMNLNRADPGAARYASRISDVAPADARAPNLETDLGQILAHICARNTVLYGIRDNLASLVQNLDGPDMDGAAQAQELKPRRLGVLPEILEELRDQDDVLKQIGQYAARLEQLA